jgi:FMN phosphatase YigB (HAD superfamily)
MRIVCFDLGGVIADVRHKVVEERLGITRDQYERAFFGHDLHDQMSIGAVPAEEFVSTAATILGMETARVRDAWRDVVDVWPAGRQLIGDCLAAGLDVRVWSNTDPIHLEKMAAQLPPLRLDSVSFRVGAMKPQREFFEKNIALLGGPAFFVDDRADNVAMALELGVKSQRVDGPDEARAAIRAAGISL